MCAASGAVLLALASSCDARRACPAESRDASIEERLAELQPVVAIDPPPRNLGRGERVAGLFRRDCPSSLRKTGVPSTQTAGQVPWIYRGVGVRTCHRAGPGVDGERLVQLELVDEAGRRDARTQGEHFNGGYVVRMMFGLAWRAHTPRPAACDALPEVALEYYRAVADVGALQGRRLAKLFRSVDTDVSDRAYRVEGFERALTFRALQGHDPDEPEPGCYLIVEVESQLPDDVEVTSIGVPDVVEMVKEELDARRSP